MLNAERKVRLLESQYTLDWIEKAYEDIWQVYCHIGEHRANLMDIPMNWGSSRRFSPGSLVIIGPPVTPVSASGRRNTISRTG